MKPRIHFCKKLYISESLEKKKTYMKWRIRYFSRFLRLFLMVLPEGESEQLEIIHVGFLRQEYYRQHPPLIVGFTRTHKEAVDIVMKLTSKVYELNHNAEIRKFIEQENEGDEL